jgi:uncharacterized RDD family membrane protein YckC
MTQSPEPQQSTYDPPPPPPVPYASWIMRVGGYLVDYALPLPGFILVLAAIPLDASSPEGSMSIAAIALTVAGSLSMLAVAVWNTVFRQGRTGWSVGKQVLGIRLIAERTGQPLGPGLTFVRLIAHILDSLTSYLGWLWPLWDPKRQTFADKVMSSVVIIQPKR